MISKNEIKYIQSLYHKKTRDNEKLFVAEGIKLASEILNSDVKIRKIYAIREWCKANENYNATEITTEQLKKISSLSTPNEVLLIAEQKQSATEPAIDNGIILVLDGIQDPGNLGSIIRTADWFGINQVVASTNTADIYNPKVVQSTMGSITRINFWYKDISEWLHQINIPVLGALLNGKDMRTFKTIAKNFVLVIGNESQGIRADILPFISDGIKIPGSGNAESLNAAVATGILLAHFAAGC